MARRTVGRKPSKPTNLTGTRTTATSVTLGWTDTSTFETGFEVQRRPVGQAWFTVVSLLVSNTTSYVDTTVSAGVTYEYRVRAKTLTAESPYSNIVTVADTVTEPAPPLPSVPTGVTVTPGDTIATVRWSLSSNATSYTLQRNADGGSFSTIASGITVAFYDDTGLTNGVLYGYKVAAVNSSGTSAYSSVATATPTAGDPVPDPEPPPAPTVPDVPTNLVATAGNAQILTSCSPSTSALSYTWKRGTVNGGPYTTIATTTIPSYTHTSLSNGTTYYVVVCANNNAGSSANSSQVSATPTAPVAEAPTAPTNLVATVESGSIRLTWTDNATTETAYQLERKVATDTTFALLASLSANVVTYLDSTVGAGVSYQYRVRAMNAATPSAYSNTVTAATPSLPPPPPSGNVFRPATAADFQAALNSAIPGDTILLTAGVTYTGNFVLPVKSGSTYITIRSSASDSVLPASGVRTSPAYASAMPKIVTTNTLAALHGVFGAHHYLFQHVEIATTYALRTEATFTLVNLGKDFADNDATTLAQLPHHFIFDRCYIHGNATGNCRRGIALNAATVTVTGCYISEIHEVGADSQALCGWNGAGPFTITNNYLEASGENVLFGGADPAIADLVPSDILIQDNTFFKPLRWKINDPSYAGIPWSVKNLIEMKNAQRVTIDHNIFENCWPQGQIGWAMLLTPRNQSGTAPWSIVKDITVTNNRFKRMGGGIQLAGFDDGDGRPQPPYTSLDTENITISNNLFTDITYEIIGGSEAPANWLMINFGCTGLVVEHNTVVGATTNGIHSVFYFAGLQNGSPVDVTGLVIRNNMFDFGLSGLTGDGGDRGTLVLTNWVQPGYTYAKNVWGGQELTGYTPGDYPAGSCVDTCFPTKAVFLASFVDRAAGNYALVGASPYNNAGTDGADIGVNMALLPTI